MNLNFKNLKIHNFMSFEDAFVDFTQKGYTSVVGINKYQIDNSASNGSGKSTIFEAISWCLTGETIRGSKEVKRIGSPDICVVELEFTVGTDNYIIRRELPSKLFLFKNNENVGGKGIRDTSKILSELLPDLTSELLGSVIILGQGLPQKFSSNTPAGRKEVLEKLSKSDFMINDIKDRISKRKTVLLSQLRQLEDDLISKQTLLKTYKEDKYKAETDIENLPKIDVCIEKINVLTNDIDSYKEKLSFLNKDLKITQSNYEFNLSELTKLSADIEKEKVNIHLKYDDDIESLTKIITTFSIKIDSLNKEIEKIRNIKDVCPTCGQKIPNVEKPSTKDKEAEIEAIKIEKNDANNKLSNLKDLLQQEIKTAQDEYDISVKEISNSISAEKEKCSKLSYDMDFISKSINSTETNLKFYSDMKSQYDIKLESYRNIIDDRKNKITNLEPEILYINNNIDNLKNHIEVVNKFETCVKREFRGYLLSNIIQYINSQAKMYCIDIFDTDKIEFKLDGNNISISYNEKEYECLSGGEKQKVDLIVQFSLRDMLCRYLNFSSNILVLDEITDNLDSVGCQKVFNLISKKLYDVENIYIISQHSDLQFPIDYELLIEKSEDGISRIV